MSILPPSAVENPLNSPWGVTNSYNDVPLMMSGFSSRLWPQESQPEFWTKFQVWEWLQQVLDMHQIDASSIPLHNLDMDGQQLCSLSHQDFLLAAGPVGSVLYHSLAEIKWSGQYNVDFGTLDLKPELDFSCPFPDVNYSSTEIFDPSLHSSAPVSSPTPSSPDIKRSYSRPHQVKKHNPRGTHLWEFIRDILLNPERNPGLIKWEDRKEGVFRFLKSEAVAQLWGKKKNNSSMTYEKLSRAMRYYYKREILERVDGRRLVYKFGRNARGWRESEK